MKRNKNAAGNLLIAAGGLLILAASVWYFHNWHEDEAAGEHAELVVPMLAAEITAKKEAEISVQQALDSSVPVEETEEEKTEMSEMEIEGKNYIGYLSIPSLKLVLPVISDWSYPDLRIAPCRQYGSVYTDDLVIAGHNYKHHFGHLNDLNPGDTMEFTDLDGQIFTYRAGEVGVIDPDDVDLVQNSPWDLVLYTCTPGGKKRVMIGAERI